MSRVKTGDVLSCEVCGLIVIVDEECGCAVAEIICCEEPMMNKGPVARKKAPAAAKPKKKAAVKKAKPATKKKAAKKSVAKKPATKKRAAKKPVAKKKKSAKK
jgi:hypothetical protein